MLFTANIQPAASARAVQSAPCSHGSCSWVASQLLRQRSNLAAAARACLFSHGIRPSFRGDGLRCGPAAKQTASAGVEPVADGAQCRGGQPAHAARDGCSGRTCLPRRARAIARNLKISPQKLNDFAAVVRRMHVQDAVLQCRYSVKKAATIVEKARASIHR